MTHKQLAWSHLSSFLWLDGNKCCDGKKKERHLCTSPLWAEARCICPSSSELGGGGNLYSCGAPMRKCLFRMHRLTYWISSGKSLAHVPPAPPLCPLHLLFTSTVVPRRAHKHLHSQISFILSAGRGYTQTSCAWKICQICPKAKNLDTFNPHAHVLFTHLIKPNCRWNKYCHGNV